MQRGLPLRCAAVPSGNRRVIAAFVLVAAFVSVGRPLADVLELEVLWERYLQWSVLSLPVAKAPVVSAWSPRSRTAPGWSRAGFHVQEVRCCASPFTVAVCVDHFIAVLLTLESAFLVLLQAHFIFSRLPLPVRRVAPPGAGLR